MAFPCVDILQWYISERGFAYSEPAHSTARHNVQASNGKQQKQRNPSGTGADQDAEPGGLHGSGGRA